MNRTQNSPKRRQEKHFSIIIIIIKYMFIRMASSRKLILRLFLKRVDIEEREENTDIEEREKERERGSSLRRQRLASPTAQVLVAQTTQPVQCLKRI